MSIIGKFCEETINMVANKTVDCDRPAYTTVPVR